MNNFNEKSKMIRFSFYTVTVGSLENGVEGSWKSVVEFKPEIIKTWV